MQRKDLLDIGRFIASLSVMLFHYFFSGIKDHKITSVGFTPILSAISAYGYMGVPFFFMISGYVICFSAKDKSAYQFLLSRFKRVYPAYWFAVLFTATITIIYNYNSLMAVTPWQVVTNLTMFQNYMGVKNVDGVYWTLFYELKFYLTIFFIILLLSKGVLKWFFRLWPFLILLAVLINRPIFIFDPWFSYFSFGALIAIYEDEKDLLNLIPLIFSIAGCFYSEYIADVKPNHLDTAAAFICYILVAAFILFFFIVITKRGSNVTIKYAYLLGTLTYPVYLIHAYFGFIMISYFADSSTKLYVYPVLIACVFAIAYLIHSVIEIQLKNVWKKVFEFILYPVSYIESRLVKKRL